MKHNDVLVALHTVVFLFGFACLDRALEVEQPPRLEAEWHGVEKHALHIDDFDDGQRHVDFARVNTNITPGTGAVATSAAA